MVDAWLVVVTVIISALIIVASIYTLVYFSHLEDKNVAWFPKIVVVFGLSMAAFSILMLPLDVANRHGAGGGFPMEELWLAVYIVIAILIVIVIPFAIFYYEAEEVPIPGEETPSQIASAIKGTILSILVFMVITVVLWITIGIAEIPVAKFTSALVTVNAPTKPEYLERLNPSSDSNNTHIILANDSLLATVIPTSCELINTTVANSTDEANMTVNTNYTEICFYPYADYRPEFNRTNGEHLKFRVTFLLYIISMIVFFGWILFIIFGGIGLVALPYDCINNFKNRPIRISLDKYTARKKEIGERASRLIDIGNALRDKQRKSGRGSRWSRRRHRSNYNKFRQAVFLLEEDYEHLNESYKRQGGKVILYFLMLLFGILAVGLTVLWILQIILFMFTQPYPFFPFLNDMLTAMDDKFTFSGVIFYGLFAFYLLLCCVKGNFKFGMRVFILFPIHPMRVNGTLMNAFLFNTLLILICAVSVTQFTTQAFSQYAYLTAINSMFAVAVRNLMGIKYIFLGYLYALFAMVFLTGAYFVVRPKERSAADQIVLD